MYLRLRFASAGAILGLVLAVLGPVAGCGGSQEDGELVETDTAELDDMAEAADQYSETQEGEGEGGY